MSGYSSKSFVEGPDKHVRCSNNYRGNDKHKIRALSIALYTLFHVVFTHV